MQTLILSLHVIVCITLVILILLQAGKEGMGVIFGGGNASVFGSSGAGGLLAKMTAFMAVLFVVTSLSYNYISSSRQEQESTILDVQLEDAPKPAPAAAPAAPAAPAEKPAEQPAANSGFAQRFPQGHEAIRGLILILGKGGRPFLEKGPPSLPQTPSLPPQRFSKTGRNTALETPESASERKFPGAN